MHYLITAPPEKSQEETDSTKEEAAKMEKEYGSLKDSTKDDNSNLGGKTDEATGLDLTALGWAVKLGKQRFFNTRVRQSKIKHTHTHTPSTICAVKIIGVGRSDIKSPTARSVLLRLAEWGSHVVKPTRYSL